MSAGVRRPAVTIRAARGGDFEPVTALLEMLGRPRVTDANRYECQAVFEHQVIDPGAHHLVAEDEERRTVGFCSLTFRDRLNYAAPQAWVAELVLDESVRGRGVGLALMQEVERRARERGCFEIALESSYRRAEAHDLYRRFGMRDSGKFFRKLLD